MRNNIAMSRAQEIKEKLALQAAIQKSFQQDSTKVLSWLTPEGNKESGSGLGETELNESKKDFFQLPVVQVGSGLSFQMESNNATTDSTDIHTLGEFIKSDKKVSSLAKKKKKREEAVHEARDSIHRISKDDTKAMIALKNKMRKTNRENIRKKISTDSRQNDSDSDDEPKVEITKKKTIGLLFTGKKKK